MRKSIASLLLIGCLITAAAACTAGPKDYVWKNIAEKADFPASYNYPVFVFGRWMVALNEGAWLSTDGSRWTKTALPDSGLNSAYQKYVQFRGAIYALGTMTGNYTNMRLTSRIARTRDFNKWEVLAESSNLPKRVFYGATVFLDKIWLVGGLDGKRYHNDVWNSSDGVTWTRVMAEAPWSPRNTRLIVYKDKMMLLGGGVIDGDVNPHPGSDMELWTTTDGVEWTKQQTTRGWAGTPVVFDGRLWLIGANRNDGNFSNAVAVSDDGINWQTRSAPWSPRGAVAVWVSDGKLYMTGGKFSETVNGQIRFIYSNDVWTMSRGEKGE